MVWQTDNGLEFVNKIMEELSLLLGSRRVFSMALHPQSNAIIERSHRVIKTTIRCCIDSVCKAWPDRWQEFLCVAEFRLRHLPFGSTQITPYKLTHGYAGTTQLSGALDMIMEIPEDVIQQEWMRQVITLSHTLVQKMQSWRDAQDTEQTVRAGEGAREQQFGIGDLVMVERSFA